MGISKASLKAVLPARIYGPLRARRVRREVERYSPRTVRHSYGGVELTVRLQDGTPLLLEKPLGEGRVVDDQNFRVLG